MKLDQLILERLKIVNKIIPRLVKVDVNISLPLILEYIEVILPTYEDKEFLLALKNYYLMDIGCIILNNYKEKRLWDIGISISPNKYYIGFDPDNDKVDLYVIKPNDEPTIVDLYDINSTNTSELIKIVGEIKFQNIIKTINNIQSKKIINVDKSQLPALKMIDGKVELDYNNVLEDPTIETKILVLNLFLNKFLTSQENINILNNIYNAISD